MKKISSLFLATLLGALLLFSLFSCGECEHEWKDATCETAKTCAKCGITEGVALGHTYGDWVVDREATETEVGAKHRTCTVCGAEESGEIAKLTHTHKYSTAWSYDDAYHWHDSTCGHDPIEKSGHTFGDWVVDREATETEVGAKHRTCSVCGAEESGEIAKLPHTHKYANEWSHDDTYHWHDSTCGHDDAVADKALHHFDAEGICECGAKDASVAVTVYIDGVVSDTLHTGKAFGYRITPPKKPEDITTNPNSEKYFYAWFVDANFQTPLTDETEFRANGAIYGKWVTVYSNHFKYTVEEGKATITSLSVDSTATTTLVIPAYINGFPVVAIGSSAFSGNTFIRTLILCNGIQRIEYAAFSGCNSITHLELPKSLTTIGTAAFENCSTLTEVFLPENVASIGASAFSRCTKVASVTIGNGVTSIGDSAFYGCASLTSITIPSSVTSIGSSAFYGCSGLTSITIPEGVTSIGSSAFYGCSGLTSITIPEGVTSIGYAAFYGCASLTSITIPEGVTSIGGSAFENCPGLTSIEIPFVGETKDGTENTYFGYIFGASNYNNQSSSVPSNLKTVVITGGTKIGSYAFSGCSGLTSIKIPEGVTSIGSYAFSGCSGLTSIKIPEGVTSIGNSAFYGCYRLIEVINHSSLKIKAGSDDCGYVGYYAKHIITDPKETYLSTDANGYIFYDDGTNVYLVGYTGSDTALTIPESVTSIGSSAFYGCKGLTSITIPEGVTSIGYSAFYGCSGLTSITLPFVGATKDGTKNTHFGYIFGASNYNNQSSSVPSNLKTVVITGGTSIGDYAFRGCSGLTSITIPEGVTSIGSSAFYGCSGLTSITIPEGVTSIGSSAFYGCSGLTSITIPEGVTSIGYAAFYGCASLTSITIPEGVTSIGDYAFRGCSGLSNITIPEGVTSIGGFAFYGCSGLTSITIPSSVTSIGSSAFYGCSELSSITIPESVTSIGYSAFYGCASLTSITIPEGVTSIGNYAFSRCTKLKDIYYTGTQSEWNAISKGTYWNSDTGNYTIHYNYTPESDEC